VPAVSALITTYERPDLFRVALESALAQDLPDIEILIGDNSESDSTEELVAGYDDPRISYFHHRPGLGVLANWQYLIKQAASPLVATLHDDDLWDPAFLATVAPPMLDDPSIAMTFNDFWIIDPSGNRLEEFTEHEARRCHRLDLPAGRLEYTVAEGLRLVAVWNAPQPAYAAVVRRDDLLACEFPDDRVPIYDIWLSYHLVRQQRGLRYEPRRLTSYRIHSASGTSAGLAVQEDAFFARVIAENPGETEVLDEIRNYWAGLRWARATRLMQEEGGQDASRQELKVAAADLKGPKRLAAEAAGRWGPAWQALRLAKSVRHNDHGAVIG
jgi:glycosyltransferase involved in cell wall biosynthesis